MVRGWKVGAFVVGLVGCAARTDMDDDNASASTGKAILAETVALSPGDSACPNGGTRTDRGPDDDGDGTLDDEEVTESSVACSPPAPPAPPRTRIVFVTSERFTANLGGLAGADAKCQAAAEGAGVARGGKTFKALLGDKTTSVYDRFTKDGTFVGVDGLTLATDFDDLFLPEQEFQTKFRSTIDVTTIWWGVLHVREPIATESDGSTWFFHAVRTGTTFGARSAGDDCLGYTTGEDRGENVAAGSTGFQDENWFTGDTLDCDDRARLYCFEQ